MKDVRDLKAWSQNNILYISGAAEGAIIRVYNIAGSLIYQSDKLTLTGLDFLLPGGGIYIVNEGKKVVKVTN
jgi:hypothetical protein